MNKLSDLFAAVDDINAGKIGGKLATEELAIFAGIVARLNTSIPHAEFLAQIYPKQENRVGDKGPYTTVICRCKLFVPDYECIRIEERELKQKPRRDAGIYLKLKVKSESLAEIVNVLKSRSVNFTIESAQVREDFAVFEAHELFA